MDEWPLRALHWSFCAFIAWASVQTFLGAWPGRDLHALILSSVELIAIAAFLMDRLAAAACIALCVVFGVAAAITGVNGQAPLPFVYFAATAVFLWSARRRVTA